MARVFLLSPASLRGKRAAMLLRPGAEFDLALRVRRGGACSDYERLRLIVGRRRRLPWVQRRCRLSAAPSAGAGGAALRQDCQRLAEDGLDGRGCPCLASMASADGVERATDFGRTEAHVHEAARGELAALGGISAPARMTTLADLALYVAFAERLLGVEAVVGAAADAQVPRLVPAAARARFDVIELEPRRRRAAMALAVGEGAALSVPLEDRAPRCA
jgi:hypothetical protein